MNNPNPWCKECADMHDGFWGSYMTCTKHNYDGSDKVTVPETGWNTHTLWKTGEEGCPEQICDSNGEVVLGLCKVCGRGECELVEPCEAGDKK